MEEILPPAIGFFSSLYSLWAFARLFCNDWQDIPHRSIGYRTGTGRDHHLARYNAGRQHSLTSTPRRAARALAPTSHARARQDHHQRPCHARAHAQPGPGVASRRVCAVRSFPAAALGCLLFPGQARYLSDPSPAACYVSVPTRAGQRSLAVPQPGAHCAAARPCALLCGARSVLPAFRARFLRRGAWPQACACSRGRPSSVPDEPPDLAAPAACGALAGPAPAAPHSWRQEDRSTPSGVTTHKGALSCSTEAP